MPALKMPAELLVLHPNLSKKELRAIINVIWKSKNNRIRQARVFNIKLPHIGTLKSHGNKKHRHSKNTLKQDKKRKRERYLKKQFTKENLLW